MKWDMQDLLAYFETWSASVKYREANHARPTTLIEADLAEHGETHTRGEICTSRFICAWGEYRLRRQLAF